MARTNDLNTTKKEMEVDQFYKKLEEFVPELKQFIDGSLQALENLGLLDKRVYKTDEVLDEIYLDTYDMFSAITDQPRLHRSFYKMAIQKMLWIQFYSRSRRDLDWYSLLKY